VRAYVIGPGESLDIRDVARPEPGPADVLVRVRAFGINRADLLQRRGLYPAPAGAPPDIPGLEFAGEVDRPGPSGIPALGNRVMGIAAGGAYAEYVVVPAGHVVPVPPGYTLPQAAAVPEAFVTAFDALERARVTSGEWVLIHAVGSGVGTAALQLARARGARCVGTSRSPAKLERARALGLEVGILSTGSDLVSAVKRATGEGAHAAVDLVGGALFPRTLESLRARGRLVLVGLTAGRTAEVDLGLMLRHRLRVEGTVLRSRSADEKTDLMSRFQTAVMPLLKSGAVRPVVDRVFPFENADAAHAVMAADQNFGKLVVEVS
jgi:putative PIG3 family NAD(P)H quinone oxidoreductase